MVIKATSYTLYRNIICANYIEAPRCIYGKGYQYCYLQGNITKSVWGDLTDGYGFEQNNPNNPDGPISCQNNVVIWNTFGGHIGGMRFVTTSPATSIATTTLTSRFDHNLYTVDAGTSATYLLSDASTYSFANRNTFWTGYTNQDFPATFLQY